MNVLTWAPPKAVVSQKLWLSLSFSILIALAMVFFWQNSRIISKTYHLQQLRDKLAELGKENQLLEANAAKENSLASLEERVQALGLEKVSATIFIQALEKSVVAR